MSGKNVGIRIRVEEELREAFQGACLAEHRHASDVLREFMRAFADQHCAGLQASLFAAPDIERVGRARAGKTPGSKRSD